MEFGKIYEGDFVKLAEELGDGWADLVCCGPSSNGAGKERHDRELSWAKAMRHTLKPDGVAFVVYPWQAVWLFAGVLPEARFHTQQVHQMTGKVNNPGHAGGAVVVASVAARPIPFFDSHLVRFSGAPWGSGFSVEIAERAIETYCPEGGVVVDPFFGMGTTAVAAIRLGRKWVGCEKDGQRINEAYGRMERDTEWKRG